MARASLLAAVPAYLAVVAVLASIVGAAAWAAHRLRHRAGVPFWLGVPLAWTTGEWLRAHLPGGLAFPWLELGASLAAHPELAGVAEVVGTRGVSLWLGLSSGLTARILVGRGGRKGTAGAAVGLFFLVALPAAWGLHRARTLPVRPVARVAVVQPALSWGQKGDPRRAAERTLSLATSWTDSLAGEDPDLVVWPETVVPLALNASEAGDLRARFGRWAAAVGASVLVGAFTEEPEGGRRHNSAYLFSPGGAGPVLRYDKRRLVPGVEAASPLLLPGRGSGRNRRGLTPGSGEELGILRVGEVGVGVLICYESAFSELARGARREGAEILVNLSEEGWFGGSGRGLETGGLWQHPAHLVMRAIEHRMGGVRAANGGFSFFVDPLGRIHDPLPRGQPGVAVATVSTTDLRTAYVRLGDLSGAGATLLTLLLLLVARTGAHPKPLHHY